jgi:Transposase DDE domain group 1
LGSRRDAPHTIQAGYRQRTPETDPGSTGEAALTDYAWNVKLACRKDTLTQAFVDHFIASYPEPPAAMVLDLDHSEDPTHGQQELTFYNHHYQSHCYVPLCIFEGTSHALVTACLRPGKRPPGAENAMILVRLLAYVRRHWPHTPILVRGDSHFATPEVIEVIAHRRLTDLVFGMGGNPVLLRQAAPVMQEARGLFQQRTA